MKELLFYGMLVAAVFFGGVGFVVAIALGELSIAVAAVLIVVVMAIGGWGWLNE